MTNEIDEVTLARTKLVELEDWVAANEDNLTNAELESYAIEIVNLEEAYMAAVEAELDRLVEEMSDEDHILNDVYDYEDDLF